jgi:hypothetical protein
VQTKKFAKNKAIVTICFSQCRDVRNAHEQLQTYIAVALLNSDSRADSFRVPEIHNPTRRTNVTTEAKPKTAGDLSLLSSNKPGANVSSFARGKEIRTLKSAGPNRIDDGGVELRSLRAVLAALQR